jgi:hypothetical protein
MASTASTNYVNALYTNLIGFSDPVGAEAWATQIDAGTSPYNVANAFLDEYQTSADPVALLYKAALGRLPDYDGFAHWLNNFKTVSAGNPLLLSKQFYDSAEFATRVGGDPTNLAASDYVQKLYTNVLGRPGDFDGVTHWTKVLTDAETAGGGTDAAKDAARNGLLSIFALSAENKAQNGKSIETYTVFAAFNNAAPTADELTAAAALNELQVVTGVVSVSPNWGSVGNKAPVPVFPLTSVPDVTTVVEGSAVTFTVTLNTAALVDQTYTFNVNGATNDAITTAATTGGPTSDFVASNGTFTVTAGSTSATFKVEAVSDGVPEPLEGFKVSVLDSKNNLLLNSGLLAIKDNTGGGGGGQTFLLTNAAVTGKADDIVGTSGDDTFNALTLNFLNTGDKLNGGAGTDQLLANVAIPVSATNVNTNVIPILTSVENLFITPVGLGVGAAGALIDLSSSTGYQQLWSNGFDTVSTVTFNNIATATGVTIGMKDIAGLAVTSATTGVTAQFTNAALAGANDTVNVAMNNVGQATGTGSSNAPSLTIQAGANATSGAETVAINVTGTAARLNTLDVEAAPGGVDTLKTLTITGDKNLRIDAPVQFAGAGGTGTVDASKFTGALNINLDNGDAVTVTGGSGNDRFAFGATLTGIDKIDGGAGTADVLAANLFTDVVSAVAAGSVSNIEGVELQLAPTTAATLDVSKAGNVNLLTFAAGVGAVTSTVNNILSGATVNIGATGTGTAQINVKDANLVANTSDVLNVNFGSSTTTAEFAVGNINAVATGVETINIGALAAASASGTAPAYTATIGNDASLKAINVTGNGDLTLTYGGQSLTMYDASKAAGIQTTAAGMFSTSGAMIMGGSANDALNGNTGNDTISGGDGNDIIIGGNGSDKITTGVGSDTVRLQTNGNAANATNSVVDAISDFTLGSGGDVLSMLGLGNAPTKDGDVSKVLVSSLTGAVPSGGSSGRAELIILDSTVPGLLAADSSALNNLLFNLGGSAGYSNVLIAYSATAGGDVRLATAVISGGDITSVTDLAVLTGVSTATLNSGFNSFNLIDFNTIITLLAPNADLSNTKSVNASALTTAAADAISTTVANLSGSTVDGGGGADTLTITDAVGAALVLNNGTTGGTLTSIEVVNLAAGSGANAVTLGGAPAITLGAASTVTLGAINQSVTGSAGIDIINTTVANLSGSNLNGNAGTDVLNITDAVGAALVLGNGTTGGTLALIDTVNLAAGSTANVTLNADASLVTLGAASTVTLGAVNQSVTGSAGNDTVNVSGTLTGTLNGNGGADTLGLSGTANLSGATITNFQTLTGNANDVTLSVAQLGAFTTGVTGTGIFTFSDAAAVNIAATNTATKYQLNAAGQSFTTATVGNYSVTGGAGNDTVAMGNTLTLNDILNGAGGLDVLTFTDVNGAGAVTDLNGVQGFETITLGNATTSVTTPTTLFTNTSGAITVDGSALTNALTWDGSSAATGNSFSITGGTANDVLKGGAGNDVFNLTVGGTDSVVGNAGTDTFNFGTTLDNTDTATGGNDADTLIISGAAAGSNKITGIENIQVNFTAGAATFTTGAIAPGATSTITAAASTQAVTLDANAYVPTTGLTIIDGQTGDTITVPTLDARRGVTTVTLSTGGNDTVNLTNTAHTAAGANSLSITNFAAGGGDKLLITDSAATANTVFQTITTAGSGVAAAGIAVLEIGSAVGTVTIFDTGAAGTVGTLLQDAVGNVVLAGTGVFVVYGAGALAGQAAVYEFATTAAGAADLTVVNTTIELLGVFTSGITADAFVGANFI